MTTGNQLRSSSPTFGDTFAGGSAFVEGEPNIAARPDRSMTPDHEPQLMGVSGAVIRLRDELAMIRGTDARVLISGERGTGKRVIAQLIHSESRRAGQPFVTVSCGELDPETQDDMLFGAPIPGADGGGAFLRANGGSVFMDEVGALSRHSQGLVFSLMETGEVRTRHSGPHGSTNVRVITSTTQPLYGRAAAGLFDEALFYRLNVVHLVLTPLRDRPADVPILVEYFLQQRRNSSDRLCAVSPEAMSLLRGYTWPQNVHELETVLNRMLMSVRHEVAEADDLPRHIRVGSSHRSLNI